MSEERNVLYFEIKKVGVDAANKALEKYIKLSKEADAVKNKSAKGGSSSFAKSASEAGQYGSALKKLNSIQKTSVSIEEQFTQHQSINAAIIAKVSSRIKELSASKAKEILVAEKGAHVYSDSAQKAEMLRVKEVMLQATFKAGLQVFQEHNEAIEMMNLKLKGIHPGVERLTEILHMKTVNEKAGTKATRESNKAIGMLTKTLKTTTDEMKRQEIQEKIGILTKNKAISLAMKRAQTEKLWIDQEHNKTRIIAQANTQLKLYNLTLKQVDKELKVTKDGVKKLTVMFQQKNKVTNGASSTIKAYNQRIKQVRADIAKSTDSLEKEALALKRKALIEARHSTQLAKRTALMKLANIAQKQDKFLLKDASMAILTYNDKIKKLVKTIQDEHNVMKKVTVANKAMKQAHTLGAQLAKSYAHALDEIEKELKQNMSAERRLALEMKQRALQEAKLASITSSTNGLLKIRRVRLDAMSKSYMKASQAMTRFGRVMIRYVTTTMVAALAQGVKFAANIEAQTVRFGVLTGSLKKGSRLFQEIIAFSAKTPFLLPQLDQAAQVLLAFGSPLKDVMTELRMLGDVAQGDAQKLERIATSFGKVRARGTAHMRELNRFIMSGVPIIAELNKQFGLTGNALFTMIQKNQISFDNINKAFKTMTEEGGKFYKMTENVAKTLEGRFSTAVDNMNLNLARLVEDFTPKLKRLLEQFIDWSQAFRTLDKDARRALVTTMAITAAIGPAALAVAGAVKLIANAVAGNWAGLIIAAVALAASFVGWFVLAKKMDDISAKAIALKESTEKLAKAEKFQEGMLPGLTKEMFDLAKAYDAYGMAVQQANEIVALQARLNPEDGEILTKNLEKAFKTIQNMQNKKIHVGGLFRNIPSAIDMATDLISPEKLRSYFNELQVVIPETETVIAEAIRAKLGTDKSLDAMTTAEFNKFTTEDWKALGAKLSVLVGKDLDEFEKIIEKGINARIKYIGSDAYMRELLGISPEDALNDWGLAVSEGLKNITGDMDTGLIDLSSGISRTQQVLASLPEMLKTTIEGLESGEIKESVWKVSFEEALSVEDAVAQAKLDTEQAITEYSNYLRDIFSMRLFEIRDTSMTDNLVSSILGITDEKDIKKQLQTQLEGYADAFKDIGLTTQELMVLDTGGKLDDPLKQDLVDSVMASTKVANDELRVLLKAQEKISLFDAFFEGDENAFLKASLEAEIRGIRATLMAGLTGVADEYKPNVWKVITDAIDSGVTDISAITAFEDFLELEGITLKVQKFSTGLGTSIAGVSAEFAKVGNSVAATTGTMDKDLRTVLMGFSNLFINTDATALIASMIEFMATLADLNIEAEKVNPLQGIFEAYFGAGSKADAKKAIQDMIDQADLNTAISTALTNVKLTETYTIDNVLSDLISGADIPNLTEEARAVLEEWLTGAVDAIDMSSNESILTRLVGDPKNLKADLQQMLDELNFKDALATAVLTEGRSSKDLLTALIGDPESLRQNDAYKNLVDLFAIAFPAELEKTDVAEDMIKAFLGTPEDWEDYIKKLRIAELMASIQSQVANVVDARNVGVVDADKVTAFDVLNEIQNGINPFPTTMGTGDGAPTVSELVAKFNKDFKELNELINPTLTPFDILYDSGEKLLDMMLGELLPAFESLGAAWASGSSGVDSFSDSMANLTQTIIDALPAILLQASMSLFENGQWELGLAALLASGLAAVGKGAMNASGTTPITSSASTIGLAKGGIVNSPQLAMIGEGGEPEAVVPLSRANDFGFGGGSVNIVVNNTAKAEVETRESTGADGSRQIEFMIYDTVKKGMNSGEFDSPMGSSYGVTRQGRR